MDNKRLILAMVIGMAILLGWGFGIQYLDRKNPHWNLIPKPVAEQPTTLPAPGGPGAGPSAGTSVGPSTAGMAPGGTSSAPATAPTGTPQVRGGEPRQVTIGSTSPSQGSTDPKAVYRMGVELTTRGAAIQSVTLNEFKQSVDKPDRYIFQTPQSNERALASKSIKVGGTPIDIGNVDWNLESSDEKSATFTLDITGAGGETLRLTKRYQLTNNADPSVGYEVWVETTVINTGPAAQTFGLTMNGTLAPPFEIERGPERQIIHAYVDQAAKQVLVRHTMFEGIKPESRTVDVTKDGDNQYPLAWFGLNGAYFNAIVRPLPLDPNEPAASWIANASGTWLNPDKTDAHEREVVTAFSSTDLQLAPGASTALAANVYFGPKKRDVLETPYYRAYPVSYDETLVTASGLCGICTFQWLIGILVWGLNLFHFVVRDWGIAIILLVFVVRTLLHPITRKSQENMVKMGKMGPKMEAIKEKYKDDKEALNRAMMQVYKEQGWTPVLGCLPMFLQMPIWIALYSSLQSTFELRQAPFLYGLTWIDDMSKPDHLIYFPTFTLFGLLPVSGFNLIPFLLAVVFFLQQHFTPKPPATTPEQEQQQKMMKWMTLLFPIFLYNAPAGLNIYILASTTFGIIESKIIRDKLKRLDDAQGETPTIIDPPKDGGGGGAGVRRKPVTPKGSPAPAKQGGLMGWVEKMQAQVEEIKKEQERKERERRK